VAPLNVIISTVARSYSATLVDLSTTGARLRGERLPEPGASFMFKIAAVQAFASIVWARGGECGAIFEEPLMEEEVESLRREAGSPSLSTMTLDERQALDDWITGKAR
jgi:hypothetical protein